MPNELLGKVAYEGYFKACNGRSLATGAQRPAFDQQRLDIQAAWQLAAESVKRVLFAGRQDRRDKHDSKTYRLAVANTVIQIIAAYGRGFFHQGPRSEEKSDIPRTSHFWVGRRGEVWFRDKHTQKDIYTSYQGRWRGFSEGGTLRALVEALRDYIRTGDTRFTRHFGPWPESMCGGDLWGYGHDEMQKVRDEIGILMGGLTNDKTEKR
jgi:hypothetical protein